MPSATTSTIPERLRGYIFHGLELETQGKEAVGDCPFCGREDKFNVSIATGQWRCWVCNEGNANGGGNLLVFLRKLWELSDAATNGESVTFAKERGLLYSDTLMHWGVVKSVLTGHWLVPGHNAEGALCQLYKRVRAVDRWELRPTPTLPHQLHGVPLWVKNKGGVWLHESWGNAAAHWEVARSAKTTADGLASTGSEASSLLADVNVLSVANCGAVGDGLLRFSPLFAGKKLTLCFDSDHPREVNGRVVEGAGFAAAKRAAKLLSGAKEPPESISVVQWGAEGYDASRPSGFDVRDLLCNDVI